MPARAMGTAAISFGLVTVPVRIYPAVRSSAGISFHMLHKKDGARLKQQFICPKDEQVVPRSETVRGYEIAKDKYVIFTDEELMSTPISGGVLALKRSARKSALKSSFPLSIGNLGRLPTNYIKS